MRCSLRNFSRINDDFKNISLKGRKYISPNDLTANEMKYILMTAVQLKTKEQKCSVLETLIGKNITFLLDAPCLQLQCCVHNTSKMLKMSLNTIINSEWQTMLYPQDIGRILSNSSDIVFCKAQRQRKLERLAKGSTVPVINVSSCRFVLLQSLSNLLTMRQHFGSLDGLTIAWIGHACPLLNTYLTIAPLLNMQVKFLCRCGGPVSPSDLHYVQSKGDAFVQKLKECQSLTETIKDAHIIMVTDHSENNLQLKLVEVNKYAHKDWVFFHILPRTFHEVEEKIFNSEKNLTWASDINYKWICAAIILRFLDVQ